ncbi:MAG: hypothetical protein JST86_02965 [Bacteroidetes bacterium]|nr:hypothetical protein [Bacteroidota bacterium]
MFKRKWMKAITYTYLVQLLYDIVSSTIEQRRIAHGKFFSQENYAWGTEVEDFIFSIPYFDRQLKNFLVGNLPESIILMDKLWEASFITLAELWVEDEEWIYPGFTSKMQYLTDIFQSEKIQLSLPY